MPQSVPESWTAWRTMVLSTVWRSRVELTAWPTSPSALSSPTDRANSRVRASSSWNNRTFSMAITAWSANVSSSLICAGVKGRTSVRRAYSVPMSSPCRRRGTANRVSKSPPEPIVGKSFCASRTSGTWSAPCSRIQRNCGSSILISMRLAGTGIDPK